MIWARRTASIDESKEIQDQFEELFMKLGCPAQMMLVAAFEPGASQTALFVSLPNPAFLGSFQGFERINEGDLPSEGSLLIGHNNQFEWHFRYPTRGPKP
jgi:hypothetical protein